MKRSSLLTLAAALLAIPVGALAQSATTTGSTIVIVNGDPDGVGFNDPTPTDPVGGNNGATLGEQRQIAFQAAADNWAASLTSPVTIRVLSTWEALTCTSTAGTLGSAGAAEVFRDFANAPVAGAWYSKAEVNSYVGHDVDTTSADIRARFNVNLGQAGCIDGTSFYLGLDGNSDPASQFDLVKVLTHEFAHGLGFQTYTNGSTGKQLSGYPSIWDFMLLDTTTGVTWNQMTDAGRAASAVKQGRLVWNGPNLNATAPSVLQTGVTRLLVATADGSSAAFQMGAAVFGPPFTSDGVAGQIVRITDVDANTGLACDPLSSDNAAAVAGNIALIDRGTCVFTQKVENLQAAGAIGVIVADNSANWPPPLLGGADPTVFIPSGRVSYDDGAVLKAVLANQPLLAGLIGIDPNWMWGADSSGRMLMFSPDPFIGGSSVSHFDQSALPHLLLQPYYSSDELLPPWDLTLYLLRDIGWQ